MVSDARSFSAWGEVVTRGVGKKPTGADRFRPDRTSARGASSRRRGPCGRRPHGPSIFIASPSGTGCRELRDRSSWAGPLVGAVGRARRRSQRAGGPVLPERHRAVSARTTIPERRVREGQDHAVAAGGANALLCGREIRQRRSCGAGEEGKHWTMVWCCSNPAPQSYSAPQERLAALQARNEAALGAALAGARRDRWLPREPLLLRA